MNVSLKLAIGCEKHKKQCTVNCTNSAGVLNRASWCEKQPLFPTGWRNHLEGSTAGKWDYVKSQ